MDHEKLYKIIQIVCTAVISVAAVLLSQSCIATLAVQKDSAGSKQTIKHQQEVTTKTDSTTVNF